MTDHEIGTGSGMTTLAVRIHVRIVGRLYVAADEKRMDVSAIVRHTIEAWLAAEVTSQTGQAEEASKSPEATGTPQLAEVVNT
jgi:hypothetical protein